MIHIQKVYYRDTYIKNYENHVNIYFFDVKNVSNFFHRPNSKYEQNKHLWQFFTEETQKYEVCVYENKSCESFLDENREKMKIWLLGMRKK